MATADPSFKTDIDSISLGDRLFIPSVINPSTTYIGLFLLAKSLSLAPLVLLLDPKDVTPRITTLGLEPGMLLLDVMLRPGARAANASSGLTAGTRAKSCDEMVEIAPVRSFFLSVP